MEPLVREALGRLLPNDDCPEAHEIGGWRPRTNNPELDLVAADRAPAREIVFAGSITWHERAPFGGRGLTALARDAAAIPGADADTPLVAVSRSGFDVTDCAATFGPEELVGAWAR